jgi:hypothetical protein
VLGLAAVDWVGRFPAAAKLAPELNADTDKELRLAALLWPGERAALLADAVQAAGGLVQSVTERVVTFAGPRQLAAELTRLGMVAWIQSAPEAVEFNENVQWVMQVGWLPSVPDRVLGRPVWQHGIRGRNQVIGLFDSGINTDHDMFVHPLGPLTGPGVFPWHRKIAAYKLYPGADFGDAYGANYHGTAVAGTLGGNDSVAGDAKRYDGVAPDARIYFVDNANSFGAYRFDSDVTELLDSVRLSNGMPEPVRQASGSFGTTVGPGQYRIEEATLDAVCWLDKHFLVVWAAGNLGTGPYNVAHPACAKNALTVGATGNSVLADRVASFSSRGPTTDGRFKPDIVAPGDGIISAYGATEHGYRRRSGTSYAAPAASGALALVRQYFAEGRHPTGEPDSLSRLTDPSSALMRACAVVGADPDADTSVIPSIASGWGRLDLSHLLRFDADTLGLTFADDWVGLEAGRTVEYQFETSNRGPLRVALAWTDTAALPAAAVSIVNDLDLELTSPDGIRYNGNQFYGGESRANPHERDERNTIEVCFLSTSRPGRWTARVRARTVFTERQPYALVVRAGLAGLPGISSAPVARPRPNRPTVVGHVLNLPSDICGPQSDLLLFDASGRKAVDLHPGTNDLGQLPAGIYYYLLPGAAPVKLVVSR